MIKRYGGVCRRGLFLLFTLAVLLWMGLIFCFSAQPADESTELSHTVGRKIGELFVPGFSDWTARGQEQFSESVDFYVRKSAHASEYAVLFMLFLGMLYFRVRNEPSARMRAFGECARVKYPVALLRGIDCSGKRLRIYPAAVLLTSAYAAADEVHQLFVPGRSGQVSDVAIDSLGALAGCFFVFFLRFLYRKIKKQKNEEEIR